MNKESESRLYQRAANLALFTILYNLLEGGLSVWFGASDETLSLFGFGIDSFIEVISAVGVWHMLRRIKANGGERQDDFEKRALRITGGAFYLLTAGLIISAGLSLYEEHAPVTTFWGVVISLGSISFMWYLIARKTSVGKALNSAAILADAACSKACLYLSGALLISSLGYELTGIAGIDPLGALIIAWFAGREGREAFAKARGLSCGCSCCGGTTTS